MAFPDIIKQLAVYSTIARSPRVIDNLAAAGLAYGLNKVTGTIRQAVRSDILSTTSQTPPSFADRFSADKATSQQGGEASVIKMPFLNRANYKTQQLRGDNLIKSLETIHAGIGSYLTSVNQNVLK